MAKYGKKAADKVEKTMHERKHGTLRSGKSGKRSRAESRPWPSVFPKRVRPVQRFPRRKPSS